MTPIPAGLPPDRHPIAILDALSASSPARARQGLAMMIGDQLEATANLSQEQIVQLDDAFSRAGLPTLSSVRLRFMKDVQSIIRRGRIRSEADYYAIRNIVDGLSDEGEQRRLWGMLAVYEQKLGG